MKNIINIFTTLIFIILTITSCKKDNDLNSIEGTYIVDATSYTNWVYFSFEKGDTITVTNPSNDNSWDIAFQRYNIKTNGGKSGNGLSAVAETEKKGKNGLDSLSTVPENANFIQDDTVIIYGYNPQNPSQPTQSKIVSNPVLSNWYNLEVSSTAASKLISKKIVYVIKTAKGKYAKFYIETYYGDDNVSGHIKFVYYYQNNGSKSFN